jgi:hypothetical protein
MLPSRYFGSRRSKVWLSGSQFSRAPVAQKEPPMPDSHEKSAVVRCLEIILSQTQLAKEYPGLAQQFADRVGLDIERTLALVIASQIVDEFGLDPESETLEFTF